MIGAPSKQHGKSYWQIVRSQFLRKKQAVVGLVVVTALYLVAIFAPLLANNQPIYMKGFPQARLWNRARTTLYAATINFRKYVTISERTRKKMLADLRQEQQAEIRRAIDGELERTADGEQLATLKETLLIEEDLNRRNVLHQEISTLKEKLNAMAEQRFQARLASTTNELAAELSERYERTRMDKARDELSAVELYTGQMLPYLDGTQAAWLSNHAAYCRTVCDTAQHSPDTGLASWSTALKDASKLILSEYAYDQVDLRMREAAPLLRSLKWYDAALMAGSLWLLILLLCSGLVDHVLLKRDPDRLRLAGRIKLILSLLAITVPVMIQQRIHSGRDLKLNFREQTLLFKTNAVPLLAQDSVTVSRELLALFSDQKPGLASDAHVETVKPNERWIMRDQSNKQQFILRKKMREEEIRTLPPNMVAALNRAEMPPVLRDTLRGEDNRTWPDQAVVKIRHRGRAWVIRDNQDALRAVVRVHEGKLKLYRRVEDLYVFQPLFYSAVMIYPPLPYLYDEQFGNVSPPSAPEQPHPMGTDQSGRDLMARMIWGSRVSLSIGFVSTSILVAIGLFVGSLAGYFRGWVDVAISRFIEIIICFPSFFLILTITAFVGPSIVNIMIVIGLTRWTGVARLTRGEFLRLANKDFVTAARALGFSDLRIMFRHILPNAIGPVLVSATFSVASAILTESGLSFLGFGVKEPVPSWGGILSTSRSAAEYWWLVIYPGVAIFLTITCYNLIGDALRDAIDPRLKTE